MKRFTGCVKRLKNDMDALHRRGEIFHKFEEIEGGRRLDGGRMRNLDDAET
jgi:hypothetical protein